MAAFSKVGGHFRNAPNDASATWLQYTSTVKALDGNAYLQSAPAGSLRAFRHYMNFDISGDGGSFADAVIGALGSTPVDYIEAANECPADPTCQNYGSLANYLRWTGQFVTRAHAKGYKVACFSWSVGNPANLLDSSGNFQSPNDWDTIALSGLLGPGGCDAIALHEYWGNEGPANLYTALRHQLVHKYLTQNLGISSHPPFVMTEIGRDCVCLGNYGPCCSGGGCGNKCGWQAQGLTPTQFFQELQTWDAIVSGDPTVLAGHVYTHGGATDFASFEIDPLAPCLATGNCTCISSGGSCTAATDCCQSPQPQGCVSGQCQQACGTTWVACCNGSVQCTDAKTTCQGGVCADPTCGDIGQSPCTGNGQPCAPGLVIQGNFCVQGSGGGGSCIADPDCIAVLGQRLLLPGSAQRELPAVPGGVRHGPRGRSGRR